MGDLIAMVPFLCYDPCLEVLDSFKLVEVTMLVDPSGRNNNLGWAAKGTCIVGFASRTGVVKLCS